MKGQGICPLLSSMVEGEGRKGPEWFVETEDCLQERCELWIPKKTVLVGAATMREVFVPAHCGLLHKEDY